MGRQLPDRKRVRLLATPLTQGVPTTNVNRDTTSQVRQAKVDAPVAAEGRAQQTEERLVLINGQQLSVTQRPALRRKNETHDSDFRQEWFCHNFYSAGRVANPTESIGVDRIGRTSQRKTRE